MPTTTIGSTPAAITYRFAVASALVKLVAITDPTNPFFLPHQTFPRVSFRVFILVAVILLLLYTIAIEYNGE